MTFPCSRRREAVEKSRFRIKTAPQKTALALLCIFSLFNPLFGLDHLTPSAGIFSISLEYHYKVGTLFLSAQPQPIVCQVIILPSRQLEQAVGIRQSEAGYEAYTILPSSKIWDTELLRFYASGQVETVGNEGKALPLEEDELYQELKKRSPTDFREIKTQILAAPMGEQLVHRIAAIWEKILLTTQYSDPENLGLGGSTYHFAMLSPENGWLNGEIWSPAEQTKTAALVDLSHALAEFAQGKLDSEALEKAVRTAEDLTK